MLFVNIKVEFIEAHLNEEIKVDFDTKKAQTLELAAKQLENIGVFCRSSYQN